MAVGWSLAPQAQAQQSERMRRIGLLYSISSEDPQAQAYHRTFIERFRQLGWVDGDNVRVDSRWAEGNAEKLDQHVAELVGLVPDAISVSGQAVERLVKATRTVPIVFAHFPDPVGAGIVDSLSRPGGNVTGFMQFEYSLCGKWVELLKQIAPETKRVAVLRDSAVAAGIGQFAVIQSVAPSFGVEVSPISLRDIGNLEASIAGYARSPNGGLIVAASVVAAFNRDFIIALSARYRMPTVFPNRFFATDGGLISYGTDLVDQHRAAAGYMDRILKGEKPANLPVQAPTKYELVINLKTAKALDFTVPPTVLARADEVIE